MKKLILMLSFAGASLFAVAQDATQTPAPDPNAADFKWESTTIDYGNVKKGDESNATRFFKFTNVGKSFSNGYASYGDAVIVKQKDYQLNDLNTPGVTFVEKTYAQEVFAKNVGLVYRELIHYKKDGLLAFPKGYRLKIAAYENN